MSDPYDWAQADKAIAEELRSRMRWGLAKPSREGVKPYRVRFGGFDHSCTCPDYTQRRKWESGDTCKHIDRFEELLVMAESGNESARDAINSCTHPYYLEDGRTDPAFSAA